jgi:hypothetical protein
MTSLLLLSVLGTTAHAAPRTCTAAELRIAPVGSAWYDVHIDGRQRISERGFGGQESIALTPGRHTVRVKDFMGRTISTRTLRVECGAVVVGEVSERRGLSVLTRWTEPSMPLRPGQTCPTGSLSVRGVGDAWYDLYVDGQLAASSRGFTGRQVYRDISPGAHFVRVTDFMGRTWSEDRVYFGCGTRVVTDVVAGQGLRVL